ncbi:MAG: GNAT family N-acetyltransferase [Deltaproteobacteria bacterium]
MIEYGKVIIRPVERHDLELVKKWYNDDEVMYWASGAKPEMMVSMEYLEEVWYTEVFTDYSVRMIIETTEGHPIGIIGFRDLNQQERRCRMIIFIGENDYWGNGYGTDAIKGFIRYLFRRWNLNRVEADTWDGNERAIAVYKKCGFIEEGRLRRARYVDGEYRDEIILGILKEELAMSS